MTADEQLAALLDESGTLTPGKDSARLREIYAEAAALVNRRAKPKKWAAFRWMYGQASDAIDPQAALEAYRESLPYWDPVADRAQWASCKSSIGWALASLGKVAPPESEEVIECLEASIDEFPYNASLLATYYSARTIGDPLENWRKRVHFLELALAQVSLPEDPVQWATLKNALAVSLPQEPDGDFAKATETRIGYHKEALAALDKERQIAGSLAQNRWIMISIDTSEAYLSRVGTDRKEDLKTAEQFARDAYQTCGSQTPKDTKALATMALARALLNEDAAQTAERCAEGLKLCAEADGLVNARLQPVVAATNEKFKALAHLELVKLGRLEHLPELLTCANRAYALLDPIMYADLRRTTMQLAADGLITRGKFGQAIDYLQKAIEAGESTLEQATTRAGRLERIFHQHDNHALLGYCFFQTGQIAKGVEAIDRGKGRWWKAGNSFATYEQIKALIPAGGALLFATFAPQEGVVAVVTESGERVCALKGFGHERLRELLLGDIRNPEGNSWIGRYTFRHANPERWRKAIDAIGSTIFDEVWTPVMNVLESLGIKEDAELVWFPQAGLGVLPLHSAWKSTDEGRRWILDRYAIRYSPSASCLLDNQGRPRSTGNSLIVSNPAGDLANSVLELAWVRASEPDENTTVLAGADATKQAVMNALLHARTAHFSTHAMFRVDDPFQSGLLMANGELSLNDLLPLIEQAKLREVVLTGCETAMSQVARRPDEFLGFPAAFLEYGASTVVATQWPVDDWASAVLIGRFFSEWRGKESPTAAKAMAAAQKWMREVTVKELMDMLAPLKNDPGSVGVQAAKVRTSLWKLDTNTQPFAHPYYWAGFTVSGI